MNSLRKKVKYPEEARKEGISGKVIVRALISEDGTPEKVEISRSDNEILDKAALNAVLSSKFKPGIDKNDKPVKAWIYIPIDFKLK